MTSRTLRRFEPLANRLCLSVSAAVTDGDLIVTGDADDLHITLKETVPAANDRVTVDLGAQSIGRAYAQHGDGGNSKRSLSTDEVQAFSTAASANSCSINLLHFSKSPLTSECGVMMKLLTVSFAVIALVAQTAQAGHLGFGQGGLGLGGHHGGFRGGGLFGGFEGFGYPGGFGLDADRMQIRFEDKFAELQSDYDIGLEEIDDYYASDDYTDVVEGLERLVDRYDLFLSGVERSIERLGDFISIATDDLTFYDDLIAEYEARDDLSEERLERVLDRLTMFQSHLTTKIDRLTEKQTSLSANLILYESFSTDLSSYLSEIITAGGSTIDDSTDDVEAAMLASSPLRSVAPLALLTDNTAACEMSPSLDAGAVPEPTAQIMGLLSLLAGGCRRPLRRSTA